MLSRDITTFNISFLHYLPGNEIIVYKFDRLIESLISKDEIMTMYPSKTLTIITLEEEFHENPD
jgi:DNA invertase Pin-like site-specific DNA recombinase